MGNSSPTTKLGAGSARLAIAPGGVAERWRSEIRESGLWESGLWESGKSCWLDSGFTEPPIGFRLVSR